jgi:hypothetical protein
MIIKYTILTIFYLNLYVICIGQNCGTIKIDSAEAVSQPHYGNNEFLLNLVDSVEGGVYAYRSGLTTMYKIPVHAWKYRGTHPSKPSISNAIIQAYINYVNNFYRNNNVSIMLYLNCEPTEITNNIWYNGVNGSNYNTMFNQNYEEGTLNIHFVFDSDNNRGRFPWKPNPYVCYIASQSKYNPGDANILVHEIGHALGLLHTHETPRSNASSNAKATGCYQEWVRRGAYNYWYNGCLSTSGKKKCEVNGDLLCDTDADPLLIVPGTPSLTNNQCEFLRNYPDSDFRFDNEGREWLPPGNNNALINIMSYASEPCRNQITPMQRGVMYNYVRKRLLISNPVTFYTNDNIDQYENDNYWNPGQAFLSFTVVNNKIELNENQLHTFHKSPSSASLSCDTDWLYFTLDNARGVAIETSEIPSEPHADTEIKLYSIATDGSLSFIISDDNTGTGNFSKLTPYLSGGNYAIEIINKSTAIVGYYNIVVSDECYDFYHASLTIAGPLFVCSNGGTFTLANVPTGANITWVVTPTNLFVNSSGIGSNPLIQAVNNISGGFATIIFTLNRGFCPTRIITKSFWVGSPPPAHSSIIYVNGFYGQNPIALAQGALYDFIYQPVEGADYYNWEVPSGFSISSGQGSYSTQIWTPNMNGTYVIKCFPINACGSNGYQSLYVNLGGGVSSCPDPPCLVPQPNIVYPNPAEESFSIFISDFNSSELRLYNDKQTLIYSTRPNSEIITIPVSNLPQGTYYLNILNKEGVIRRKVIVKH